MIVLPELPYDADALKPTLSARAMRVHHDGHHAKYVEAVNALTEDHAHESLEALITAGLRALDLPLLNNACQAWNHALLWNSMAPDAPEPINSDLRQSIDEQFGSLAKIRQAAINAGKGHFGSGWLWLAARGPRLTIATTRDGDTLGATDWTPLLVCDLWEHAYYLDHLNDRDGYLAAWWSKLANWRFAEAQFEAANGRGLAWTYAEGSRSQALHSRAELLTAIDDVAGALAAAETPDQAQDDHIENLLARIADYQQAPAQPLLGEDLERLEALNQHLKAFGVRWPARPAPNGRHWAPALGGDLGFHR
jgi:Fe-Mn family superoxide dismutase